MPESPEKDERSGGRCLQTMWLLSPLLVVNQTALQMQRLQVGNYVEKWHRAALQQDACEVLDLRDSISRLLKKADFIEGTERSSGA